MIWAVGDTPLWLLGLVVAAWAAPRDFRASAPAVVTAAYLAVHDPFSLALLAGLTLVTHALLADERHLAARGRLAIALIAGTIVVAKWGVRLDDRTSGARVLGLAFYTLRLLHLVIDRLAGRLPPARLADTLRWLFFLPTLAAGPINRLPEFQRDAARHRWDDARFAEGLERMLYGAAKIVILGNWVGSHLDEWIPQVAHGFPARLAYLGCLRYGWNLYCQFSGYSDVAIGLAALTGFRAPENFDWPFLAKNIGDFWNRWHMSLSQWCRDYVFTPVVARTRSAYAGSLASMLVLGLWHELSPRYVAWGVYHGLGIAAWRGFQRLRPGRPGSDSSPASPASPALRLLSDGAAWLLTMHFVTAGFALTSTPGLAAGLRKLVTVLTFGGIHV